MPPDAYVNVAIDGRTFEFLKHASGVEYQIDSSQIRDLGIWSCMTALKDVSGRQPRRQDDDLDSYLIAVLDDKLPWEQRDISGAHFDLHHDRYEVEFSLNTAVGTREATITGTISALAMNSGFGLVSVLPGDDEHPIFEEDGYHQWRVRLSCDSSQATFANLLLLRRRMSQAIFLPSDMITTPQLALRMVQLGQVEALLGLEESEWLEVKSSPYDLKRNNDEKAWKLELAKDIAQFANSEIGGLLVIGLSTRKINSVDTVDRVTAFPISDSRVQSYRDIIKQRVHPPITGLQLGAVERQNLHIVYAFVPPQREENRPYLVAGAIIDGIYESQGITIVRRQGDASIPVTAREIHSALVAGRALLRGTRQG